MWARGNTTEVVLQVSLEADRERGVITDDPWRQKSWMVFARAQVQEDLQSRVEARG